MVRFSFQTDLDSGRADGFNAAPPPGNWASGYW